MNPRRVAAAVLAGVTVVATLSVLSAAPPPPVRAGHTSNAQIFLGSTCANPGTNILVSGTGWHDGGGDPLYQINIRVDGVDPATTTPGQVNWGPVSVPVPSNATAGQHTIVVSQNNGHVHVASEPDVGPLPLFAAIEIPRLWDQLTASHVTATSVPFTVPCPEPTLMVDPHCGPAGAPPDSYSIDVSGTNWGNFQVNVEFQDFGGTVIEATTAAPAGGSWFATLTPERQPEDFYYVVAKGQDQGGNPFSSEVPFDVPCPPLLQSVELSQTCEPAGDPGSPEYLITVSGAGWSVFGDPIEVYFQAGDTVIASVDPPVPAAEIWSVDFNVEAQPLGPNYSVVVRQHLGFGEYSVVERPFAVTEPPSVCPQLTVVPVCGASGALEYVITVSGQDFDTGQYPNLWLSFQPESVVNADDQPNNELFGQEAPSRDSAGDFSGDITVPGPLPDGDYAIRVYTAPTGGQLIAEAPFPICRQSILIEPSCLSSADAADGFTIILTGTDWYPDASQIELKFQRVSDDSDVIAPVYTDAAENWVYELNLPGVDPDAYRVVATQMVGQQLPSEERSFIVPCRLLTLEPLDCGTPSGEASLWDITVNGAGFNPNHSGLFLFLEEEDPNAPPIEDDPTPIQADANGEFSRSFSFNQLPDGVYAGRVRDDVSGGLVLAQTPFVVPCPPATITLEPDCAAAGPSDLTVSGLAFRPHDVTILFGSDPTPHIVTPAPDGSFVTTFTVSADNPGTYTVSAEQGTAGTAHFVYAEAFFVVPCPPTPTPGPTPTATIGPTPTPGPTLTGSPRPATPTPPVFTVPPTTPPPTTPPPAPSFDPSIEMTPPIGQPGFITIAVGSNFPPNTLVELEWRGGSRIRILEPVMTDDDGDFRVGILVLSHEKPGMRRLVAPAADNYSETGDDFLCVPKTVQPPNLINRG